MNTYYDESGKVLGKAWSVMTCTKADRGEDHRPHPHHPHTCRDHRVHVEGYPNTALFDTPPRKRVN